MKRRLRVDLVELVGAFDSGPSEASYFLDLETGEVSLVTEEIRSELEACYEAMAEARAQGAVTLAEILERRDLPQWEKELVLEADRVEAGFGARYIRVPRDESRDAYRDMEAFVPTVDDGSLQAQPWRAIEGRGAFRRFRDVLADHPHERDRWFAFKEARLRERVLDWLEAEDVDPILD